MNLIDRDALLIKFNTYKEWYGDDWELLNTTVISIIRRANVIDCREEEEGQPEDSECERR